MIFLNYEPWLLPVDFALVCSILEEICANENDNYLTKTVMLQFWWNTSLACK